MRKEGLHVFSSYTITQLIFIVAFTSLATASDYHRHPCSDQLVKLIQERNLTHCRKLHTLDSALAWNYFETNNGTHLDIFLAATIDEEPEVVWLAWGVNPGRTAEMVGTKAIIGIKQGNLSTVANTYDVTEDTKRGCEFLPSPDIGLQIIDKPSMKYYIETHIYAISAKMILPSNYNIRRLNHVWQVGYQANDAQPYMHPDTLQNVNSAETIDLTSGRDYAKHTRRGRLRIVHGVLSIVGWGTFLPIGVFMARYFKMHPIELPNRLGYKLHVLFQMIGYTIGTTGWAIGLFLGTLSKTYMFQVHRTYGIVIFTCATAQVFSYRVRPDDEDEYRKYWNMFHHFLGYGIIVLIIINIFQGIEILNDGPGWKWTYVGLLGLLGLVGLGFEIYTWVKFKVDSNKKKPDRKPAIDTTNSPAHQELDKSTSKTQNDLPRKQP